MKLDVLSVVPSTEILSLGDRLGKRIHPKPSSSIQDTNLSPGFIVEADTNPIPATYTGCDAVHLSFNPFSVLIVPTTARSLVIQHRLTLFHPCLVSTRSPAQTLFTGFQPVIVQILESDARQYIANMSFTGCSDHLTFFGK